MLEAIADKTVRDQTRAVMRGAFKAGSANEARKKLQTHADGRSMTKIEVEILAIPKVASYLKVAERTIYRLAGARRIPAFKTEGTWRFAKSEIDKWIKTQTAGAPASRAGFRGRRK